LRDLGGLVVIDFIDMENQKNQREVEDRLREALHHDRARVQTGKISRFGLLELSRQRLQPSLGETSYVTCPRCAGTGHVRSTESFALHLLRMLQEEAMKDNTGAVHLQIPVDVATFLLNEKRHDILAIEARHRVEIMLIPNMHFEVPRYNLARFRHDQLNQTEPLAPSYRMVEKPVEVEMQPRNGSSDKPDRPQPVVQGITPSQPAPAHIEPVAAPVVPVSSEKPGLFGRLFGWLRGGGEPVQEARPVEVKKAEPRREREPRRGRDGRNERGDRAERGERDNREPRGDRRPRGDKPERVEQGDRPARPERTEARPPREPREPREGRQERTERPDRGERGERPERPRRERQPAAEAAPASDQNLPLTTQIEGSQVAAEAPTENGGEERDSRRRGRRGGRGRRGEGRPDSAGEVAEQTVSEIVAEAEGQPASTQISPAKPSVAVNGNSEPLVIRLESEVKPEKAEIQAVSESVSEPIRQPAAQPVQAEVEFKFTNDEVKAEPKVVASQPVAADLTAAGLQMVETLAQRAQVAQSEAEPVESSSSRRRRGRGGRASEQTAAERLVMVETRLEGAAMGESVNASAPAAEEKPNEWGPPSNPRRRPRPKSEAPAVAEPLVLVETKSAPSEQPPST
jgi:ribonuclease E